MSTERQIIVGYIANNVYEEEPFVQKDIFNPNKDRTGNTSVRTVLNDANCIDKLDEKVFINSTWQNQYIRMEPTLDTCHGCKVSKMKGGCAIKKEHFSES